MNEEQAKQAATAAQFDQAGAALAGMATTIGQYWRTLTEQGITEDLVFDLTMQAGAVLWHRAFWPEEAP